MLEVERPQRVEFSRALTVSTPSPNSHIMWMYLLCAVDAPSFPEQIVDEVCFESYRRSLTPNAQADALNAALRAERNCPHWIAHRSGLLPAAHQEYRDMIDWQKLDERSQNRSDALARRLTRAQIISALIMGLIFALATAQPGSPVYELGSKALSFVRPAPPPPAPPPPPALTDAL
jgi:hypothetical protein